MINKIISGGQTGVDQAGLFFGKDNNIKTGGTISKGFRTEDGPDYTLKDFNLVESHSSSYVPRTIANVENSDATLVFYSKNSNGTKYTIGVCNVGQWVKNDMSYWTLQKDCYKPCFIIHLEELNAKKYRFWEQKFLHFVKCVDPKVLNIAGPRESIQPGVFNNVYNFLSHVNKNYGVFGQYII